MDGGIRTTVEPGPAGTPVVRKVALDEAGRAALEREAGRLTRARHPGVVELIAHDADHLDMVWAGGRTLETARPDVLEAAAILASVATTVADLHSVGIVHGRLEPSHVVLDPDGRPRLCGFAGVAPGEREPGPAVDVAALGRLADHMLGDSAEPEPIPERRWGRRRWSGYQRRALLTLADQASHEDAARRPTARAFAAAVVEAVPEARLEPRRPAGASSTPGTEQIGVEASDGDSAGEATEPPAVHGPGVGPGAHGGEGSPGLAGHDGGDAGGDADGRTGSDGSDLRRPPEAGSAEAASTDGALPVEVVETAGPVAAFGGARAGTPAGAAAPTPHGVRTSDAAAPRSDDAARSGGSATFLGLRVEAAGGDRRRTDRPRREATLASSTTDPGPSGPSGTSGPSGASRPPRRPHALVAAVALTVVALGLVSGGWRNVRSPVQGDGPPPGGDTSAIEAPGSRTHPPAPPVIPRPASPDPCPAVSRGSADVDGDGCPEALSIDGTTIRVAGATWVAGRPGDHVAVGDWNCDGTATPGVVRPSTGEVFVFEGWTGAAATGAGSADVAPGASTADRTPVAAVTVEPTAVVPGAGRLRPTGSDRDAHGSDRATCGFDVLLVDGTSTRVEPTDPPTDGPTR